MVSTKAFFLILAMASSLLLAGCYSFQPVSPEEYRKNPELLQHGDTVIIRSSDQPTLKGKIVERSSERIVVNVRHRVDESITTDRITSIEVKRLSEGKTTGVVFLGILIVGAVVGMIYIFSVAFSNGG